MKNKKIIDVCCGSRMFWFDKLNPNVIFMDKRNEKHILCDGRKLVIKPDIVGDFTNLKFKDNSFNLVVFDPPHLKKLGRNSWMAKKYGVLPKNWEIVLKKGFNECWRVLANDGILIFKWGQRDIKIRQIIELFGKQPLFGHTTKSGGETIWMCFMKIHPELFK
jgi:SAM-dependent methyltransferase